MQRQYSNTSIDISTNRRFKSTVVFLNKLAYLFVGVQLRMSVGVVSGQQLFVGVVSQHTWFDAEFHSCDILFALYL